MKTLHDASKELMNHVIFALNHSMDLKKDGVDPMMPFAVVVTGDEKVIKVFGGDTLDYADKMFERTIKEEKPDFVVYASDTYLTVEGIRYDAVLFKAFDKNDQELYLIGQKYKPKTTVNEFEQIGNPGFLGTEGSPYFSLDTFKQTKATDNVKPWWRLW